jgi:aminomethyltransferase
VDREEAVRRLREAADELDAVLGALPDPLLDRRLERWTPKDVAAHLVGWNHHLAQGLRQLVLGQPPFYLAQAEQDFRELNAESVARWGGLDREALRSELRRSLEELVGFLESLPAEAWERDFGVRQHDEPVTVLATAVGLAQDYTSHTERLRAWAARQGAPVPRRVPLRTALHGRHLRLGARMVEFAGWEMPLQYRGIVAEHRAVRTSAGLFDVSHMGELRVFGPGALDSLDRLLCNDPRRLAAGQALYTPMCREDGGVLDDLVACRLGEDRFLLVVNAARREEDAQWVRDHAQDCTVRDVSFFTSLLALQGPRAEALLQQVTDFDLARLPRFHVSPAVRVAGVRARVSRTGYTGEDGFEILTDWLAGVRVWDALVELGAFPCGLGARDTLRLEAGYLLYGQDLDESTTPLEAGLGWTVKLEGRRFVGADALRRQKEQGVRRRLCGLVLEGRAVARPGFPVLYRGQAVGRVTSGTFAPWVGRSIALAYLPAELAGPGTRVEVQVRDRPVAAEVVRLPFYRRSPRDGV